MKEIKVVIGSSFGDEGKGLMTDFFAVKAAEAGKRCIVACYNGGAQRGHTVVTPEGLRHVFHHFGSGVFAGAATYLAKEFMINPIVFRTEYEALTRMGYQPRVFINPDSRITLPYDMMVNQEIERLRGGNRHGSCGYGILETVKRNQYPSAQTRVRDMICHPGLRQYIETLVRSYYPARIRELGYEKMGEETKALMGDQGILEHFTEDLKFLFLHAAVQDEALLSDYDSIVFEGGQGLLLDENNQEYFPHLTPSRTGLYHPWQMIKDVKWDYEAEVCYVTRTYLTRHGAGKLEGECAKAEINPHMEDLTNQPNEYQGALRYAKLDVEALKERIAGDYAITGGREGWKQTLAVTHENEYFCQELAGAGYHSAGMDRTFVKSADGVD